MLIVPLPAGHQPQMFRRLDTETVRRMNDGLAADGYRSTLRCEWPNMNQCGGRDCDPAHAPCDGCERAERSWFINARINIRARRFADD